MAKKQIPPARSCAECIHESACRLWTDGRPISDASASRCPGYETVKDSAAYLCGVLDERKRKQTNADRIRAMSDEDLAAWMAECNAYKEYADASQWLPWLQKPAEE